VRRRRDVRPRARPPKEQRCQDGRNPRGEPRGERDRVSAHSAHPTHWRNAASRIPPSVEMGGTEARTSDPACRLGDHYAGRQPAWDAVSSWRASGLPVGCSNPIFLQSRRRPTHRSVSRRSPAALQLRLCLPRGARTRRDRAPCRARFGVKSLGLIWDTRRHRSKQKPPIYGGFRSG
jgi:hypothetical protein